MITYPVTEFTTGEESVLAPIICSIFAPEMFGGLNWPRTKTLWPVRFFGLNLTAAYPGTTHFLNLRFGLTDTAIHRGWPGTLEPGTFFHPNMVRQVSLDYRAKISGWTREATTAR